MTIDEALDQVEAIRQLKDSNPQWERFFMAGYLTATRGISVKDLECPPLPLEVIETEIAKLKKENTILNDLYDMLEDREHQGNLWWFREWKKKQRLQ